MFWTDFYHDYRYLVIQMMRLYFIKGRLIVSNQSLTPHHYDQVVPKADNLKPQ